jgi:hypothetical protein
MKHAFFASAAIAALIAGSAVAQQAPAPSYPNPTEVNPTPKAPPTTPAAPPAADAGSMKGDSAAAAMPTGPDMTADKLQGIAVYTPKPAVTTTSQTAPAATGTATRTTTTTTTAPSTAQPSTAPVGMAPTASKTVSADELKRVRENSQSVGEINDLVIGADGKVKNAVVDVGGFLGMGERSVAIAWADLSFIRTSEGDTIAYISKEKAELEKMPEYTKPK